MASGSSLPLQGASLLQLTEALVSRSDQVCVQLERLSNPLGGVCSHAVDSESLELQCIGQRGLKHSASPCELTDTLWTTISRISSSINQTRPAHRLPPEVLAEVFTWYQHLESTKRHDKWFTWVRFMSVSHRWRSTILSFPSLWSVVHLDGEFSPEIIRMLLGRSGGHPLNVIVPHSGSTPKSIRYSHALDASAHTPRIQKFLFNLGAGGNDAKHIARIFSKPAPSLTHLELATHFVQNGTTPFPDLFGLEFPNLRVLEVTGIEDWPEIVGANLTHININASLDPWLLKDYILYSPNLKALTVQGVLAFGKPDLNRWQRIALPPGVCLTIRRSPLCSHILSLFTIPHDGHIKVNPTTISVPDMPLLFYALPIDSSPLQNLRALTRLHMKARCIGDYVTLELKCFKLDRLAFEVNVRYSFQSQALVQQKASPAMWFLSGLNRLALKGVEEWRMDGFVGRLEPQATELFAFLTKMPALTRLITTDSNEGTLRSAIGSLGYPLGAVVVRVEE